MRERRQIQNIDDENIFWVTMSDLLLGLVVTFLVLFIFAITGFTQNKVKEQETQHQVATTLAQELKKNNINVDIDKFSGKIKISDLELFELNKWELSPKGKLYLNKFIPVYLNTILGNPEIKKNISQIIIEGHTDSQSYAKSKSSEENYVKNLDLSLKRASSVADYIVYSKNKNNKDLVKLLSVNGKSFTEPILVNGKEDYNKSRRVELKIVFKDNKIEKLLKAK